MRFINQSAPDRARMVPPARRGKEEGGGFCRGAWTRISFWTFARRKSDSQQLQQRGYRYAPRRMKSRSPCDVENLQVPSHGRFCLESSSYHSTQFIVALDAGASLLSWYNQTRVISDNTTPGRHAGTDRSLFACPKNHRQGRDKSGWFDFTATEAKTCYGPRGVTPNPL